LLLLGIGILFTTYDNKLRIYGYSFAVFSILLGIANFFFMGRVSYLPGTYIIHDDTEGLFMRYYQVDRDTFAF